MQGCQVKMLNGIACTANIEITTTLLSNAIRRLSQLAFVGDADDYENSICLFHAMFGGNVGCWAAETTN